MTAIDAGVVWPIYTNEFFTNLFSVTNEAGSVLYKIQLLTWERKGEPFPFRLETADEHTFRRDLRDLVRLLAITPGRFMKKVWPQIARHFDISTGKLCCPRLDQYLDERRKKAEIARQNGHSGGRPRKQKELPLENPAGFQNGGQNARFSKPTEEPNSSSSPSSDSSRRSESEGERADARRAQRLPADFKVPQEWVGEGYGQRKRHGLPEVDLDLEAAKFCNYWQAKGGADSRKLDWHSTWINWCLKAEGGKNGRQINGRVVDIAGADDETARRRAGLAAAFSDVAGRNGPDAGERHPDGYPRAAAGGD